MLKSKDFFDGFIKEFFDGFIYFYSHRTAFSLSGTHTCQWFAEYGNTTFAGMKKIQVPEGS